MGYGRYGENHIHDSLGVPMTKDSKGVLWRVISPPARKIIVHALNYDQRLSRTYLTLKIYGNSSDELYLTHT